MNNRAPREWLQYQYREPGPLLIEMRRKQHTPERARLEYKVASLRTRKQRPLLEARFAALFAYGMSTAIDHTVEFALHEAKDFDFVARYTVGNEMVYVPVQLKEWVPLSVNPNQSLQDELDKLEKYTDSSDLVIVFCLNRTVSMDVSALRMPKQKFLEIWFLVCTSPNQENWALIGNMLESSHQAYRFMYPNAA